MLGWGGPMDDRSFRVQKRAITPQKTCPNSTSNTYTTIDGLSFDLYCGQNFLSDTLDSEPHSNIQACMESCSLFRPRCYGVSYNTDTGNCQFKDKSDVSLDDLHSNSSANSAVAHAAQLASPSNTSCPFPPNSYQYTTTGMQFEILCNLDTPYGDYQPTSLEIPKDHANSLQDCMKLCSISHPLCVGVSWNPDMGDGFANCYLKNSQVGTPSEYKNFVTHSALWRNDKLNVSCPADTTNPSSITNQGKSFEISCNSGRLGGSNTSYHDTSFNGCVSTCATNSSHNCLGVVYDGSLQGGFSNCYLLNATGEPTSIANSTFALYTPSKDNITAPPPPPSHSSSKAWIAGPVIGAVAIIALLVGFLLWRRRKRSPEAENISTVYASTDYKQLGQSPYRSTPLHELPDPRNNIPELAPNLKPSFGHELDSEHGNAHELG